MRFLLLLPVTLEIRDVHHAFHLNETWLKN